MTTIGEEHEKHLRNRLSQAKRKGENTSLIERQLRGWERSKESYKTDWCGSCLFDGCRHAGELNNLDYIVEMNEGSKVALKISHNEKQKPTILYIYQQSNSPTCGSSVTIGKHYFKDGRCLYGEFSACRSGMGDDYKFGDRGDSDYLEIHEVGKDLKDLNKHLGKFLKDLPEKAKERIKDCFED